MYKEWHELLFPPPPVPPRHQVYRMHNGLWGITNVGLGVLTHHETYEAAQRSADALNVREKNAAKKNRRGYRRVRWY
jgi:hypothetical protein